MTRDDKHDKSSNCLVSIPLTSAPLRAPIEEIVSRFTRRKWSVKSARDMSAFAYHHCAILADDAFAVFVKYSQSPQGAKQFEVELAGLRYLAKNTGVMVPTPIDIVAVENGTLLIMEALKIIERTPLHWRQIGRALARIHRKKSDYCGFPTDGFLGPIYQDNTPTQDWLTFYRERLLRPRLRMAIDSGNIPSSVACQVETLIQRLPELCGPETTPSLLHGDAQQNNFINTAQGTFVIDPAIYYGNPEIDLAYIDCFQPAPDDVLDAYREEMPIDPGFFERRDLWRVSIYLAAVALEGPMHLYRLTNALQSYS
jgi:protein-ribulosamine 3-kinase